MSAPVSLRVDDVEYVRADSQAASVNPLSPYKIVILQRGWVMVGRFTRYGENCTLDDAKVLRQWGTKKGLGELVNGPLAGTVADPCNGQVGFHVLAVVATIAVNASGWS